MSEERDERLRAALEAGARTSFSVERASAALRELARVAALCEVLQSAPRVRVTQPDGSVVERIAGGTR